MERLRTDGGSLRFFLIAIGIVTRVSRASRVSKGDDERPGRESAWQIRYWSASRGPSELTRRCQAIENSLRSLAQELRLQMPPGRI